MELKNYQQMVMRNLSAYMDCLNRTNNIYTAWTDYWFAQDINVGFGVPRYNNALSNVPHICTKVPTGGGKTFMACAALKRIYNAMPPDKPKVVVWLVPSDPILAQTIKNLTDVTHAYRLQLDRDFSGKVGVHTKEQLLNGQQFSPDTVREMLTVCILSYGSLRINSKKKDVRKVYQENGNLKAFADYFKDDTVLLADTPDTALLQVLRHLSPVVVVDESHNAGSDLSVEMLNNLNPSFVLDLTATPRKNSNIISYVDARELKKENMVKLPVVVYNRSDRHSVVSDALRMRNQLERQAAAEEKSGGEYIRPIVLFQAQPKTNSESETFDKIKDMLMDMGIPGDEIGIKTSKVDTISKQNLMSRDCKIRYIITVNALKEGWDCPFAYILASLANKTSTVDVEQILGRILRQPYAKQHKGELLNSSYVLTCSKDFRATLDKIVEGLNRAGFSRRDFRLGESETEQPQAPPASAPQTVLPENSGAAYIDTFDDIRTQDIKAALEADADSPDLDTSAMVQQAERQSQQYKDEMEKSGDSGFVGGELGDMLNQNGIQAQFREEAQALRIPQFFLESIPDLFGDKYVLLEKATLSTGFSLSGQDAQVSFKLAAGEMYTVDIQAEGEAVPKYRRTAKTERDYIQQLLADLPQKQKITQCTNMIVARLDRNNRYAATELADYVRRIVNNMTKEEQAAMETAIPSYAERIRKKIKGLEEVYREKQFYRCLDSKKIICRESYVLPSVITPANTIDSIPLSLYEAERDDMNPFEREVIDMIVSRENTRWWHRIIEKTGFRINGFINHYPDFMVMTKSGNLVIVEAKGDYLDGDNSKTKLKLGRKWQAAAGNNYHYFMVFKDKDLELDGAYTLDSFLDVFKDL